MEWISVRDRLPEDNEEYLVVDKYNVIYKTYFLPSLKAFTSVDDPIYWMPLPDPPQYKP